MWMGQAWADSVDRAVRAAKQSDFFEHNSELRRIQLKVCPSLPRTAARSPAVGAGGLRGGHAGWCGAGAQIKAVYDSSFVQFSVIGAPIRAPAWVLRVLAAAHASGLARG